VATRVGEFFNQNGVINTLGSFGKQLFETSSYSAPEVLNSYSAPTISNSYSAPAQQPSSYNSHSEAAQSDGFGLGLGSSTINGVPKFIGGLRIVNGPDIAPLVGMFSQVEVFPDPSQSTRGY